MTTTGSEASVSEFEREVQRLLQAGEHAAAAAALRHVGEHGRAAKIYESIFEPAAALAAWEAAGDVVSAVRVALSLDDDGSVDRLVSEAIARGAGDALLAALARAGRYREVGRVWRARGELLLAARAFEDAGVLDDAADCLEDLGQVREAGVLLERWLELHPEDDDAAVRLGRILARFGRHDDAIALLQRALRGASPAQHDVVVCRAAPTLALAFVALGYDDAAHATVARWQTAHRRLGDAAPAGADAPPPSLEILLRSARAAAFLAVQTSTTPRPAGSPPASAVRLPGGAPPAQERDEGGDSLLDAPVTPSSSHASTAPGHHGESEGDEQRLLLNGRYLLGEPLGGGGVGQVFRAYDAFADRPVAVKIFGAQLLSSDAVQAWAREVRAIASLGHPGFVKLVELNMAQGFVASELLGEGDGGVLVEERMTAGADGAWLLPMLQHALDALALAHRSGLVHGGLKPQNIFLVGGGVKLLDAGAHRLLALRATETGGLATVWPWLSPEQLMGGVADVDADLYALAAIAYRALTGRPPYDAAGADRSQPPPPPAALGVDVPAAWSAFVARALRPARGERFASAEEMRQALPPPLSLRLPRAAPLHTGDTGPATTSSPLDRARLDRYVRRGLVGRHGAGDEVVKVFAARDAVVGRAVFLLEADEASRGVLAPYVACARLWRGVQPVYDVLVGDGGEVVAVVVAADDQERRRDVRALLAALRAVPQGLARDLCAVAEAITSLHEAGVAVGGFDLDRACGPIGPRLQLAPAPLLLPATPERIAADADSFTALVEAAFGVTEDPSLDARGQLLAALHDGRFLERADLNALAAHAGASWVRFLPLLIERLVAGAPSRAVARLVRAVVKGA